jgi:hypothetical protein
MTGHRTPHDRTSIDDLLAERFRADAPAEAPSWLLPAVQERITRTPQQGSRPGAGLGRFLAVAAVLVLAIGAALVLPDLLNRGVGVLPSSSPAPSGAPSPSGSASVEPSPSASAAPSASPSTAPPSGPAAPSGDAEVVLLAVTSVCDVTPPVIMPAIVVTADGTVVWQATSADGLATEYRTRRLSAQGLADLHDRLAGTGLLAASGRYEAEVRPGVEPPGMGGCLHTFTYRSDPAGEPVIVESSGWYGDELESQYFVPAPERRTLDELLAALREPEAMLGPDAWFAEGGPFVPDRYLVVAVPSVPQLVTAGAPDVDDVTWPFDAAPDAFGEAVVTGSAEARCGIADAGRVETLAAELAAAGLEQFAGDLMGAGAVLPWASRDAALDVGIWPVVADDAPGCDDLVSSAGRSAP